MGRVILCFSIMHYATKFASSETFDIFTRLKILGTPYIIVVYIQSQMITNHYTHGLLFDNTNGPVSISSISYGIYIKSTVTLLDALSNIFQEKKY